MPRPQFTIFIAGTTIPRIPEPFVEVEHYRNAWIVISAPEGTITADVRRAFPRHRVATHYPDNQL